MAKTINNFVSGPRLMAAREQFFSTLVLSVILRNGDAHLKNFGVVYDDPLGSVELAPVYDLVTTTAYISNDVPALTIAGTKKWWPHKFLERFGVVSLSMPKATILAIFDRMAQAVTETQRLIPRYISEHPEFRDVGERIMASWDEGLTGFMVTGGNRNIHCASLEQFQGLVRVSSWEFKSPLWHHNKINRLQKKPLRFGGAFLGFCRPFVSRSWKSHSSTFFICSVNLLFVDVYGRKRIPYREIVLPG